MRNIKLGTLLALTLVTGAYAKKLPKRDYVKLEKECDQDHNMKSCQVFKTDCDAGIGQACYVIGVHVVETNTDQALELFEKACDQGFAPGCKAARLAYEYKAKQEVLAKEREQIEADSERAVAQRQEAQRAAADRPIDFSPIMPLLNSMNKPTPQPVRTNCVYSPFFKTMDCETK